MLACGRTGGVRAAATSTGMLRCWMRRVAAAQVECGETWKLQAALRCHGGRARRLHSAACCANPFRVFTRLFRFGLRKRGARRDTASAIWLRLGFQHAVPATGRLRANNTPLHARRLARWLCAKTVAGTSSRETRCCSTLRLLCALNLVDELVDDAARLDPPSSHQPRGAYSTEQQR